MVKFFLGIIPIYDTRAEEASALARKEVLSQLKNEAKDSFDDELNKLHTTIQKVKLNGAAGSHD